ncbi:MAG: hypothetical protein KY476_12240 [Planctomycetes bacterium]|nr:hypothetical protein [Planctomycetota bacterium]
MPETSANLIPATRRPVPLVRRRDLTAERITYQAVPYWVVKDPIALAYYRLQIEQYAVLELLDGERSLEDLRSRLQREFPTLRLSLKDLHELISDLHHKGLVYSLRSGQGAVLLDQRRQNRRRAFWRGVRSVLYIRLPGFDPQPMLARLYPLVRWMFTPWAAVFATLFVLFAWGLLFVHFGEFERRVPGFQQFFAWPNLVWLWATIGAAKLIHELAHGLACRHYGGECHEIGVAFLVFSPCLYCDVSDSWILRAKRKRILIGAAGMAIEVVLSAAAILLWWNTQPGLFNHLCLNVFFVTTITTVIFNANPLLRFDGYYILCDWLEIPNLRPKADRLLQRSFARYCLGIESPPDPFMPDRGRGWFVLYSIASALYRWFLVFSIIYALYHLMKPYGLQNLGLALGVFSALAIVAGMLASLWRMLAAPRRKPMSRIRLAATLTVIGGLVTAGLMVPLPLSVEAPFVVEPVGVEHVYTTTPGRLVEVRVRPGDVVRKGDVLARLANFSREDDYRRLKSERDAQAVDVEIARALRDPGRERLAQATCDALDEQLAEAALQLEQLTLRAPANGVVIAPPRVGAAADTKRGGRLRRWTGTPLDEKNRGCHLAQRTHVLSIAPSESWQAVLVIDQLDREQFAPRRTVELQLEERPGEVYHGRIARVSDRHLEYPPPQLSNKFGGTLATQTDRHGNEQLAGAAWQALVALDDDGSLLRSGLRGRARFTVETRTAGQWAWRYLKQTLHFRM